MCRYIVMKYVCVCVFFLSSLSTFNVGIYACTPAHTLFDFVRWWFPRRMYTTTEVLITPPSSLLYNKV